MNVVEKFKFIIVSVLVVIALCVGAYKMSIVRSSHLQTDKKSKVIKMESDSSDLKIKVTVSLKVTTLYVTRLFYASYYEYT